MRRFADKLLSEINTAEYKCYKGNQNYIYIRILKHHHITANKLLSTSQFFRSANLRNKEFTIYQ